MLEGRIVRHESPPSSEKASQKRDQLVRISCHSRPFLSSTTVDSETPP
jgi:hypothetical protein